AGSFGQLGNGDTRDSNVPVTVAGEVHFSSLTAGSAHTCGISTDREAWCWGSNASGALGIGTTSRDLAEPALVAGGHRFTMLDAGVGFTCGVTVDQRLYCWGSNGHGELGDGTREPHSIPEEVSGDGRYRMVSAGLVHVCALSAHQDVFCWGLNDFGQLGDSTLTPALVPIPIAGGHTFSQVRAGHFFSCGLTDAGEAWCWGSNISFEMGNGSNDIEPVVAPEPVATSNRFTRITSGAFHSCALRTDRSLMCWGANTNGKLGNGTFVATVLPTVVAGPFRFIDVSSGGNFTCGLAADDGAYCWGSNQLGQLGNGKDDDTNEPTGVFGHSREHPGI
ncbi:MAG: RCC1 domain-containing protein, partial [Gemmatimonadales bacterium]